jgi:hypothetical protein
MTSNPDTEMEFFIADRAHMRPWLERVADVLIKAGHSARVQDYDIPISANFVGAMHRLLKLAAT